MMISIIFKNFCEFCDVGLRYKPHVTESQKMLRDERRQKNIKSLLRKIENIKTIQITDSEMLF